MELLYIEQWQVLHKFYNGLVIAKSACKCIEFSKISSEMRNKSRMRYTEKYVFPAVFPFQWKKEHTMWLLGLLVQKAHNKIYLVLFYKSPE